MSVQLNHGNTNSWFVGQLAKRCAAVNPADVAADLVAMVTAFQNPMEHRQALAEVLHQIDVISRSTPGTAMRGRLNGWRRHKFLSDHRMTGVHADLRIVYRTNRGSLEIFGFGHRRVPQDIYVRLRSRPLPP